MSLRTAFERREAALASWATQASLLRVMLLAGILSVVMSLPGFVSIPPIDRDEARFAQATKQMMETGDYIDIRLQDEARHKKPVGIYWMQAAVAKASTLGADAPIWVYRIPSLLGIAAAVMLSVGVASVFLGKGRALFVGLLVAAAILPNVEARLAKTDAVLLATIVAFHWLLAEAWLRRGSSDVLSDRLRLGAWFALGIGVLVKGPIAPMVVGLTALALCVVGRDWRWLRATKPLRGLAVVLLIAAPWYLAIGFQTDWAFYAASAGEDLLGKAVAGQESHGAPPGVHLLAALGTFWPLSPLLLLALPAIRGRFSEPTIVFALCWIVPTWVVFELVPTKLPHYVLPTLPAVALLAVTLLKANVSPPTWLVRAAQSLFLLAPTILCIALVGAGFYLMSARVLLGAAVLAIAAVLAFKCRPTAMRRPILPAVAIAFLVYVGTFPLGMAGLTPLWVSSALANAVEKVRTCDSPSIYLAGFREPSAVFLIGTDTQLVSGDVAARALSSGACTVVIVDRRQREAFDTVAPNAQSLQTVEGINLNGGDDLRFAIFASGS